MTRTLSTVGAFRVVPIQLVTGAAAGGTCSCGAWPREVPTSRAARRGFDDLSVDEKIDYLQSLWDRIAASPESIPVPDWHREILDERLKDLEANPDAGDTWEAVQERLRKKLDSRQ